MTPEVELLFGVFVGGSLACQGIVAYALLQISRHLKGQR